MKIMEIKEIMRRSQAPAGHEQGSSILTVLVIAAFLSITIAGIVNLTGNRQKEMRHSDLRASRDLIYQRVSSQISSTNAMRNSIDKAGNSVLKGCLNAPAGCRNRRLPFVLHYPFSPTISRTVAGNVTYSDKGQREVGAASEKVPFIADSFFTISERTDPSGKLQWLVTTEPEIKIRPGVTFQDGLELANRPLKTELAADAVATKPPYKTKFEMLVKDILDAFETCGENSFLNNAQHAGGSVAKTCTCLPGFVPKAGSTSNPDRPQCEAKYCTLPQIFVGFQVNNAPLCIDQDPNKYICTSYNVPSTGKVNCPNDNKMRALQMSPTNKCRLTTGIPGCPRSKCVKCDNVDITCCKRK